jgi:hypothetical protein
LNNYTELPCECEHWQKARLFIGNEHKQISFSQINIVATGTTTAGVVRIFVYNGTNYFLLREVLVSAITPSTTVAVFSSTLVFSNLVIPTGYSIRVTTNNAETFHVSAFGGDF